MPDDETIPAPATPPVGCEPENTRTLTQPPGLPTVAAPARLPLIPGYEALAELGRGGMGVVYRAREVRANRDVAIKLVLSGPYASHGELARFRTEAEASAGIQHPGVVHVLVVGEHDGHPYLCMEYCGGGSLEERLATGPLAPQEAAALVADLADAVQAAHDRRVIHRDLKPANVLFTADGRPKVTDFGLAKRLDGADGVTASGAVMGTPSYMAPEQAAGLIHTIGPAADVYALGAILYRATSGRPPFRAESVHDTLLRVINQDPEQPRSINAGIPRDLESICLKCLAKRPQDRYATAADLAADLRRFLAGRPVVARPVGRLTRVARRVRRNSGLVVAVLVIALSATLAAVLLRPTEPPPDPRGVSIVLKEPWQPAPLKEFTVPGVIRAAWGGPGSSSVVVFLQEAAEPVTARFLADSSAAGAEEGGMTVAAREVRTVGGMRAMWVVVTGKGTGAAMGGTGDVDMTQHWVAVPRGTDVIVVLLTCRTADYPDLKHSFDEALTTMKLGGTQTPEQKASE